MQTSLEEMESDTIVSYFISRRICHERMAKVTTSNSEEIKIRQIKKGFIKFFKILQVYFFSFIMFSSITSETHNAILAAIFFITDLGTLLFKSKLP